VPARPEITHILFHRNTSKPYNYLINQLHVVSRCPYVLLWVEEAQRELNQIPETNLGWNISGSVTLLRLLFHSHNI